MQPIHAVNFAPFSPRGAFSTPQAKAGLCAMKEQTCADTVIFCPGAVQATPFVEQIDFQGKHTTSDEELLDMTRLARQLGQLSGRHMAGPHLFVRPRCPL